jgi:hypothetical protein
MEASFNSAIQKMGSNFLVAAFVPATAFILISLLVFGPILPPDVRSWFEGDVYRIIQASLIILTFITVLGFTLFSLSIYIYKAFEGYSFVLEKDSIIRRSFVRRQIRRYKLNETKREWVKKQIGKTDQKVEKLSAEGQNENNWRVRRLNRFLKKREWLDTLQYELVAEHSELFPPTKELIMPTRFGNILRAAEMYPATRYRIDAVQLWGRLAHVIPKEGMEKVDEANNQCLFLLNASLLAFIFSVLSLIACGYQALVLWARINSMRLLYFIDINLEPYVYNQRIAIYFVLAIFAIAVSWFFYEASLLNVGQYGDMIRTSYDLYRFKLLEALHFELPATLKEERKLWRSIRNFMIANDGWVPLDILEKRNEYALPELATYNYLHSDKQKTQDKPEIKWYEKGTG